MRLGFFGTMADAVTLIVLVAASEASSPTTRAMTHAMHEALGPSAHVIVHETNGDPNDAEALAAERKEGSDAAVELVWADARHHEATLRAHIARTRRWFERSLAFRPSDAEAERGRTLGFTAASILPEAEPPPPENPPAEHAPPGGGGSPGAPPAGTSEPTPATPPAPAPSPAPPAASAAPSAAPSAPAAPPAPSPAPSPPTASPPPPPPKEPASEKPPGTRTPAAPLPAPAPPEAPPKTAPSGPPSTAAGTVATSAPARVNGWSESVERSSPSVSGGRPGTFLVAVLGNVVPGRQTTGYGASLEIRWFALPDVHWLSFGVGGGAVFGTLGEGGNASFDWALGNASAGATLHAVRASPEQPFGVEARVDADLLYLSLKSTSSLGQGVQGSPFNWGFDAFADGTWMFARGLELRAGAGAASAFWYDAVSVVTGPPGVRVLNYLRPVLEAGFRVSF